jgi:DNA polymerase III delta prime subunit
MQLLVDKYKSLNKKTCLLKFTDNLQHLLLVGSASSDKEVFVDHLLEKLYGEGCKHIKESDYTINNYGSNTTKVKLRHSNYHMIITPNNSALDKYILQEVIVDFCRKRDLYFFKSPTPFKCVVIHKADNLSEQAQFCLRRVMETTSSLCRFILLSSNPCNFICPIRSRFIQINIPTPDVEEIQNFISEVASKEAINADDVQVSTRDYKELLWKLESKRHNVQYYCWWEITVDFIANYIVSHPFKSLKYSSEIRDKLGQLFVSNIEAQAVIYHLMKTIFKQVDVDIHKFSSLSEIFSRFDCRLRNATRYILHMEALINNLSWVIHHSPLDARPALL